MKLFTLHEGFWSAGKSFLQNQLTSSTDNKEMHSLLKLAFGKGRVEAVQNLINAASGLSTPIYENSEWLKALFALFSVDDQTIRNTIIQQAKDNYQSALQKDKPDEQAKPANQVEPGNQTTQNRNNTAQNLRNRIDGLKAKLNEQTKLSGRPIAENFRDGLRSTVNAAVNPAYRQHKVNSFELSQHNQRIAKLLISFAYNHLKRFVMKTLANTPIVNDQHAVLIGDKLYPLHSLPNSKYHKAALAFKKHPEIIFKILNKQSFDKSDRIFIDLAKFILRKEHGQRP